MPNLNLTGDIQIGGHDIKGPDGAIAIHLESDEAKFVGDAYAAANLFVSGSTIVAGDLTVSGGDIFGPTDGHLKIRSDGNIILKIDSDNDGTNKFVIWDQGENSKFEVDESGNVQMDGSITIGSNTIKASDGGTAITLSNSDNVTIGNNLILGNNRIYNSDDELVITVDADQNATIQGDLTVVGNDIKNNSGNLTIDSASDIILDADGGDVIFKDDSSYHLGFKQSNAGDWAITNETQNKDIVFNVQDGGTERDILRMTGITRPSVIINETVISRSTLGLSLEIVLICCMLMGMMILLESVLAAQLFHPHRHFT